MAVIGMWGKFLTFKVSSKYLETFKDLTVDTGERIATHDIYRGGQLVEWLGSAASSFKMTIDVLPQSGGDWKPRSIAHSLRQYLKLGWTAPLIIGGRLITQEEVRLSALSEKWERIDGYGNLTKLTADVTFTECPRASLWR